MDQPPRARQSGAEPLAQPGAAPGQSWPQQAQSTGSNEPPYDPPYDPPYEAPYRPAAAPAAPRRSMKLSIPGIVIGLAMLGSLAFIGYVVLRIEDNQIPLMASGFVVLGASLAAIAVWCVVGMWRAASRARGGRAFVLAIVGGLAGLGAIGCFTVAAVSALVSNS